MKKTLLAIFCLAMAYTSWAQIEQGMMFNMDVGLGIPSEAAREVAEPSGSGTVAINMGLQKSLHSVGNITALVGFQFTHLNMTHDEKHSPADFGEITHDLETNTSLLAPTIRFETSFGNFYPYVEAGAGLMMQRSNIVTSVTDPDASRANCTNTDITRTKLNDMQTQLGLQSSVGLAYGLDNWKVHLSANFVKGTQSFLMPERNFGDSFTFDDPSDHYNWQSVRPDIMNIRLGMSFTLGTRCYGN